MANEVQLVRVMTDDREQQLWVAATSREDAVALVLNSIPEGWTAVLLDRRLTIYEMEVLNLKPGDVREITSLAN